MRKGGRIVNVSSQSGQLKYFHPRLQPRFLSRNLTLAELDALIGEYSVRYFGSFLLSFQSAINRPTLALSRPAHCDRVGLAPLSLLHKQGRSERRNPDYGPRQSSSAD